MSKNTEEVGNRYSKIVEGFDRISDNVPLKAPLKAPNGMKMDDD
jgi:hypothetical protein